MTSANPDALADALVDQIARILDLDAHHLGRPDYYGPEQIRAFASARVRVSRQTAGAIIAGPLAPILAAKEAAEARAAQLQAEVAAVLVEATRMSSILLMAGEMTAQERRTARAVARGISLRVRTALAARAATAREGAPPPSPTPSDSV